MQYLDSIDRKLIGLLRINARTPISHLSKEIRVSRATIQNRINKLEKNGVITGYTTLLVSGSNDDLALVRALMNIELDGNVYHRIKSCLLEEPAVTAIHSTNGRWDIIVELQTNSLETFDEVLSRIGGLNGIATSETRILLTSTRVSSQQA